MKIKYLGTAAAEGIPAIFCDCENCVRSRALGGRNIRTRSQAIVDDKILIDFPADTYFHSIKENINLSKIHTCLITHSHSDHLYASELEMRKREFAHVDEDIPITFYSDESAYTMISDVIKQWDIRTDYVVNKRIHPFEGFMAEGYKITPVRASHDPKSTPVLFVIEKDGKSIFYANDSSEYIEETMECLKSIAHPIDVISLDCTEACNSSNYVGHLDINRCINLRKQLLDNNIANENTVFILNHFSHNGKNVVYDDFVKIAEQHSFIVSYDGMEYEF